MDQVCFELTPVPPFRLDLTVWALRRGDQDFCHVSLTITVP